MEWHDYVFVIFLVVCMPLLQSWFQQRFMGDENTIAGAQHDDAYSLTSTSQSQSSSERSQVAMPEEQGERGLGRSVLTQGNTTGQIYHATPYQNSSSSEENLSYHTTPESKLELSTVPLIATAGQSYPTTQEPHDETEQAILERHKNSPSDAFIGQSNQDLERLKSYPSDGSSSGQSNCMANLTKSESRATIDLELEDLKNKGSVSSRLNIFEPNKNKSTKNNNNNEQEDGPEKRKSVSSDVRSSGQSEEKESTLNNNSSDEEVRHMGSNSSVSSSSKHKSVLKDFMKNMFVNKKVYPMVQKGYCAIFNHENFDEIHDPRTGTKRHAPRTGTKKDKETMERSMLKINMEVTIHDDLTKDQIESKIKDLQTEKFNKYSCLIIVTLTHGSEEELLAKDGTYNIGKLWLPFKGNEIWKGKPKIFIFQSCRGLETDSSNKSSTYMGNLPKHADFLFANSSPLGCSAYRDHEFGAPYIQKLGAILQDEKNPDLLKTLVSVCNEMCAQNISGAEQCPTFTSMLRGKVVFKTI